MDVKTGSGAFMPELDRARELAQSIVEVANGAGLRTASLLTDMNQVLGTSAGNALEVMETVAYLTGAARESRLHTVVGALAVEMLCLGRLAETPEAAAQRVEAALESGRAAEVFARMVAALGGPKDLVERPEAHLPHAPVVRPCRPEREGVIMAMDVRRVGLAIVSLGGGRRRAGEAIDYRVGLSEVRGLGDHVGAERPLALVHAADDAAAEAAMSELRAAVRIGESAGPARPIVIERLGPGAASPDGAAS